MTSEAGAGSDMDAIDGNNMLSSNTVPEGDEDDDMPAVITQRLEWLSLI